MTNRIETRRFIKGAILASIAGAVFLAAFLQLSALGISKRGRVLINEHNSNWEGVEEEYSVGWFGSRVGYNYYLLRKLLECNYDLRINKDPLSDSILQDVDVLFVKMPTAAFETEEIAAVERFVNRGGGLVVFGDHTNVFGSSTFLNPLLERFQLTLHEDSQHDLGDGGLTLYRPDRRAAHPMLGDLEYFLFGTGCTLTAPLTAEDAIVGYGQQTAPNDYAVSNFFAHEGIQLRRHFGYVLQTAGSTIGNGRVVLFTDSTVFSNFWMFVPGKPELLLGMFRWANQSNLWPHQRLIWLIGAIISIAFAAWRTPADRRWSYLQTYIAAFALSSWGIGWINRLQYPVADVGRGCSETVFLRLGNGYFLPREALMERPADGSPPAPGFQSLYMTPARLGKIVREVTHVSRAVDRRPELIVILKPRQALGQPDIQHLRNYVQGGGNLLVLTGGPGDDKTELLLYSLGMSLEDAGKIPIPLESPKITIKEASKGQPAQQMAVVVPASLVSGGKTLHRSGQGDNVIASSQIGAGRVILCSCPDAFSDEVLGQSSAVPNRQQLQARVFSYWLFEQILNLRQWGEPIPTAETYFRTLPTSNEEAEGKTLKTNIVE